MGWIFYMGFMVFAMLNIVTAFFVESTLKFAAEDTKVHISKKLWEIFQNEDVDSEDMLITKEMFEEKWGTQSMHEYLQTLELHPDETLHSEIFDLLDVDQSGAVDAEELVAGCMRLTGPAKAVDLAALQFECHHGLAKMVEHQAAVQVTLN